MRKLFSIFFVLFIVISCKKEKAISIEGYWGEVSKYSRNTLGQYESITSFRNPGQLYFTADGKCSYTSDVPGVIWDYQYNSTTKLLKFFDSTQAFVTIYSVARLDENSLTLERFENNELQTRLEYIRK